MPDFSKRLGDRAVGLMNHIRHPTGLPGVFQVNLGEDMLPNQDPQALQAELSRTRAELVDARQDAAEARAQIEAVQSTKGALAELAASAPGALWVAEAASGHGIYVSPGVRHLLGVSPEEVLPEAGRWLGLVHPDDRPAVAARFDALRRGEAAEVAYRVLPRGDGATGATSRAAACWVSDLGFPIIDAKGRVRRVAGFAHAAEGGAGEEGLRRLLLAELNHPVRNALAAVQSVAAQTALCGTRPAQLLGDLCRARAPWPGGMTCLPAAVGPRVWNCGRWSRRNWHPTGMGGWPSGTAGRNRWSHGAPPSRRRGGTGPGALRIGHQCGAARVLVRTGRAGAGALGPAEGRRTAGVGAPRRRSCGWNGPRVVDRHRRGSRRGAASEHGCCQARCRPSLAARFRSTSPRMDCGRYSKPHWHRRGSRSTRRKRIRRTGSESGPLSRLFRGQWRYGGSLNCVAA